MTSQTARRPTEQVSLRTLALIAALGILLRVIIAYVVLPPDAGFAADLNAFRSWASELGTRGPWGFYARGMFVDYLPGYMWVLWGLGSIGALITGSTDPGALVKLPAILAFLAFVEEQRCSLPASDWAAKFGRVHTRITVQVLPVFSDAVIAEARRQMGFVGNAAEGVTAEQEMNRKFDY